MLGFLLGHRCRVTPLGNRLIVEQTIFAFRDTGVVANFRRNAMPILASAFLGSYGTTLPSREVAFNLGAAFAALVLCFPVLVRRNRGEIAAASKCYIHVAILKPIAIVAINAFAWHLCFRSLPSSISTPLIGLAIAIVLDRSTTGGSEYHACKQKQSAHHSRIHATELV